MHLVACSTSPLEQEVDFLVLGVHAEEGLSGAAIEVDHEIGGSLRRLWENGDFAGKTLETQTLALPSHMKARFLMLVGLGSADERSDSSVMKAAATAAKQMGNRAGRKAAFHFGEGHAAAGICGAIVGGQGQDLCRAERKLHPLAEIRWSTGSEDDLRQGRILGESVNMTRRLVNLPPNEIYPASVADEMQAMADEVGLGIEIWDEERLAKENCGALLAVARGSERAPRLAILSYQGASADQPPIALVGKGVTFDSGGYSLKPTDGMKDMKCDMAGAATVIGAMRAIALRKPKVNVLGLVGLVENLVSGDAYKLGDVLKSRNGKTIEILNTDAEGRVVLADVLDVAVDRGADRIADWCAALKQAAEETGEQVWELPMFPEFGEQIQSRVADIKNVGNGRWGGAITAAKFLEEFVQEKPWVHIDIAGPAYLDGEKPWLDAGGSGAFVRTLVQLVENA
jgi:leucyl aminopeptidase